MIKPIGKHVVTRIVVCLLLALPIVATVSSRVHEKREAIALLEREKIGLQASLTANDVLGAVDRYRIAARDPRPEAAAIRRRAAARVSAGFHTLLEPPDGAVSNFGPRTSVTQLRQRWEALLAIPSLIERERETLPLADEILAVLLDIDDRSGLTYDTTVESINLSDALAARLPSQSERRDQSAETVELAHLGGAIGPLDIIHAERSSGEAHDALGAAIDDFDGAVQALPEKASALRDDRAGLVRAADGLTAAIDALILNPSSEHQRLLQRLRDVSVDSNDRVFGSIVSTLRTSFDSRIAAGERSIQTTLALGAGAAILSWLGIVALSWAMRRRHQAELARAHERAQVLETQLAARNAERARRMTEQHFRAVFDRSLAGIAILDRRGGRIDANAAFRRLFDHDYAAITAVAMPMFAQLERDNGSALREEHRFVFTGQPPIWAEISLALIRDDDDNDDAVSAIVMVHDITAHKTLHEQLDRRTLHDELTALPNRLHFMRRLDELVRTHADPFAVVFIDLDRFKAVNDTLGHHAGDRLLRLAAGRLSEAIRPCDFVARLHGDEFAVLLTGLPSGDSSELEAIVMRLDRSLRISMDGFGTALSVSASIGVVRSSAEHHDPERYLREADAAMYHSKVRGRGCATFYDAVPCAPEIG